MFRTTGLSALFASLALFPSTAARAGDDDVQFWATLAASGNVADDTTAQLDISNRFRDDGRGGHQIFLRGTVDYRPVEWISIGGGLSYVDADGPGEVRPHEQVTLYSGPFALRSRLEERFIDGAPRPALRLRERLQFTQPIGSATRLSLMSEVFVGIQATTTAGQTGIEAWRNSVQLQRKLGNHVDLSLTYLVIDSFTDGKPDRLSHVPQVTLAYKF